MRNEQQKVFDDYAEDIMADVLADQMIYYDEGEALPEGVTAQTWDINGHQMVFAVVVASPND
jgi:hypothetical protein